MKILVTGQSGYLGTRFLDRYSSEFDIRGYDLLDGNDILDYKKLSHAMEGCEQVVHLAAIPKPVEGKSFDDYFRTNVEGTHNIARAAAELGLKRIVYASSTTVYGIEQGIPFRMPIKEDQPIVSQYIAADQLSCRDVDLAYHISKVMAEQIMAWYGLNKKIQTTALRFGPIGKVFLGTSVSDSNAAQAIKLAIATHKELWYEPFSIVDEIEHIDITKAKTVLGYQPKQPNYPADKIRSAIDDRTRIHS